MELAPSILTADFARLGAEVGAALDAGIRWLHLDVMDGRFVPNLTFGPQVARALRPLADRYGAMIDAHLMIVEPERYVEAFAAAGCDMITVHAEADVHLHRTVQLIHSMGLRAGAAINPGTPLAAIEELLPELDLVLVMTVNPGFGGQTLIPTCLDKVVRLRRICEIRGLKKIQIQIDGGVNTATIAAARDSGADVAVVGSAVYNPAHPVHESLAALWAALEIPR